MANAWFVIVIVGLVVAGIALVPAIKKRNRLSVESQSGHRIPAPDYTQDREDARLKHMSDEDRAWESATLQRHHDNQARAETLAKQRQ